MSEFVTDYERSGLNLLVVQYISLLWFHRYSQETQDGWVRDKGLYYLEK